MLPKPSSASYPKTHHWFRVKTLPTHPSPSHHLVELSFRVSASCVPWESTTQWEKSCGFHHVSPQMESAGQLR